MGFWNKRLSDEGDNIDSTESNIESTQVVRAQSHESEPLLCKGLEGESGAILSSDEVLEQRFGKLRSALGPGTVIQGKLSFDTPVRIDGKLSGEIFSSKAIIVGPCGAIDARIEVNSLIIMGKVCGNVVARDRVELLSGGSLEGDLTCPIFVVEEGASFNGTSVMSVETKIATIGSDKTEKALTDRTVNSESKKSRKGSDSTVEPGSEELRAH